MGLNEVFDVLEYKRSREEITEEFEEQMPLMMSFVKAWIAAEVHGRRWRLTWKEQRQVEHPELTAKSYFCQEAEGISRIAKIDWALKRGDHKVTSLQHDGVIVVLKPGITAGEAATELGRVSGRALGYPQPVEDKKMDQTLLAAYVQDDDEDG